MKKSIEDIERIRKEKREELDLRVDTKYNGKRKDILVCHGTGCTSSKSPEILEKLKELLKEKKIDNVNVVMVGCLGLCSKGPVVIEDNVWIGDKVTILGGVTIGDNAIIGANSVVTHDIPSNCMAAGMPAKATSFYPYIYIIV